MLRLLLALVAIAAFCSARVASGRAAEPVDAVYAQVADLFVEACVNRYGEREKAGAFIREKYGIRARALSEQEMGALLGYAGELGWTVALPPFKKPVLIEENFINACSIHLVNSEGERVRAGLRLALDQLVKCCGMTYELREEMELNYKGPARFTHFRLHRGAAGTLQLTVLDARPEGELPYLIMSAIVPKN